MLGNKNNKNYTERCLERCLIKFVRIRRFIAAVYLAASLWHYSHCVILYSAGSALNLPSYRSLPRISASRGASASRGKHALSRLRRLQRLVITKFGKYPMAKSQTDREREGGR